MNPGDTLSGTPWRKKETGGIKPSAGEQAFLQQINETRKMVSAPLLHFQEKFKQAATVREKTAALYGLLQESRRLGAAGIVERGGAGRRGSRRKHASTSRYTRVS
ncbi:MAG: hypothetical protein ACOX1J_08515 [Dethiobacteria bacterium]